MENNNDIEIERFQGFLLIMIALIVAVSINFNLLARGFHATDDNVYTYVTGQALFHGDQAENLQEHFVDYFSRGNATEEFQYRLKLRKNYVDNYVFHSGLQYITARFINPLFGINIEQYPLYMTYAAVAGTFFAFFITLAIVLLGIKSIGKFNVSASFTITLVFIGLLNLLPLPSLLHDVMLHDHIWDSVVHSAILMLNTGSQYNLLSFPERANYYLLAFLIFIVRSRNKFSCAYWLVVVSCFFHQSQAGLILMLLFSLDMVLRPHIFKSKDILIPFFVSAALFATRETLWALIGKPGVIVILGLMVFIIAFFLLARYAPAIRKTLGIYTGRFFLWRDRYLSVFGFYADAILVLILWLITWPITYWIVQYINHFTTYYFWSGVHARTWALISPFLWYCTFYCLLNLAKRKWSFSEVRFNAVIIVLVVGASIPLISNAVYYYKNISVVKRVAESLVALDQALASGHSIQFGSSQGDELIIYYGIAKTIDTGKDWYSHLAPGNGNAPAN